MPFSSDPLVLVQSKQRFILGFFRSGPLLLESEECLSAIVRTHAYAILFDALEGIDIAPPSLDVLKNNAVEATFRIRI